MSIENTTEVQPQNNQQQQPQTSQTSERAPGRPLSLDESWSDFKKATEVTDSTRPPEKTTDILANATPAQVEEWNRTGKLPAAPQQKAKTEPPPESQREANQSAQQFQSPQQAAYERLLERASKDPDFEKIVGQLHEPLFPNSREGAARMQVAAFALQEVSNGDEVVFALARPENASVLAGLQNASPQEIAKTLHLLSAELRYGTPLLKRGTVENERPKPRAPKPPSEVGGRGTPPADGEAEAIRKGDFAAAERIWNQRAFQKRS